jgi:hypothetical protein
MSQSVAAPSNETLKQPSCLTFSLPHLLCASAARRSQSFPCAWLTAQMESPTFEFDAKSFENYRSGSAQPSCPVSWGRILLLKKAPAFDVCMPASHGSQIFFLSVWFERTYCTYYDSAGGSEASCLVELLTLGQSLKYAFSIAAHKQAFACYNHRIPTFSQTPDEFLCSHPPCSRCIAALQHL